MNLPLIDARSFEALQAHAGADFVRALVETFSEEAQQLVRDLCDAAAQGDAELFETAAHTLKSNAATFGATRLAELARGLEWAGLGADSSGAPSLAAELAAELTATLAALRALAQA